MYKTKKLLLFIILIMLLQSMHDTTGFPTDNTSEALQGRIIHVDYRNTHGPWFGTLEHPYRTINDALNNASDGDTVYVKNGVYTESIIIDKRINLVGEDKYDTIIDGNYTYHVIISIIADNVTLSNITISNPGGGQGSSGLKTSGNYTSIKDSIVYRCRTGITLDESRFSNIERVLFYCNSIGLHSKKTKDAVIKETVFIKNAIGVYFNHTDNNNMNYSSFNTNGLAVYASQTSNLNITHSNISDNSDNHGGLILRGTKDTRILNCFFNHNGMGVDVGGCFNTTIHESYFTLNTHFGILTRMNSDRVIISRCEIKNNLRYGVYVTDNSVCIMHSSNIHGNHLPGLLISESSFCDARYNYWGSVLGPSLIQLPGRTLIKRRAGLYQVIPYSLTPAGINNPDTCENNEFNLTRINSGIHDNNVPLDGDDNDNDKVPDYWEIRYGYDPYTWDDHFHLDPDQDGLNNVEEYYTSQYGSHPFRRDVFLEVDYMESRTPGASNKPDPNLVEELKRVFLEHNIVLHVDTGDLGGGEMVPYTSNFSFSDLCDLYWDYFLHGDPDNPRKGVFHYGLICDYGPGRGFAFIGWDHLDSFLISAEDIQNSQPRYKRDRLIIGGMVHELGHTLGLNVDDHRGIDNLIAAKPFTKEWLKYRNYKSCMNYIYTYKTFEYSDGSKGLYDYDDWGNMDLSFFKNTSFLPH